MKSMDFIPDTLLLMQAMAHTITTFTASSTEWKST